MLLAVLGASLLVAGCGASQISLPSGKPLYGVITEQRISPPRNVQAKVIPPNVLRSFLRDNIASAVPPSPGPVNCPMVDANDLRYVVVLYYPKSVRAFSFDSQGCPFIGDLATGQTFWSRRLARGIYTLFSQAQKPNFTASP